jgi:hypothetical protein
MRKAKDILAFTLLLFIIAGVWFLFGVKYGRRNAPNKPESKIIRDTVTCTIYDTIVREKPVFRYSYITDTVQTYFTTVEHDSVLVDVPIERKVYAEDSLYWAVVSGWRCSLDSLILYPEETVITIHEKVKVQPCRWSFGITAGPSVLATPSGRVYGGLGATVGLTYNF